MSQIPDDLNIAIVDDDAIYRTFISKLLSKNNKFKPVEASSGDELCELLDNHTNFIDCILLDYNLGQESGFAVKARLAERFKALPPIVMLTSDEQQSTVIKALRVGINDYVSKLNLRPDNLYSAIVQAVDAVSKQRQHNTEYERLKQNSDIDYTTGLFGYVYLEARVGQLAQLSDGIRSLYALIVVEMNELPDITAKFGLKTADACLRKFADKLRRSIRSGDICGRCSVSSFLIIVDLRNEDNLLARICENLSGMLSFRIELDTLNIPVSSTIGAARCDLRLKDGVVSAVDLISVARQALEAARTRQSVSGTMDNVIVIEASAKAEARSEAQPLLAAADQLRTTDRRREPRHRVFKRGLIILKDLNATLNCTVRNISEHGAGLRLEASTPAPLEFELEIVGVSSSRRAHVKWQNGADVGVEFVD